MQIDEFKSIVATFADPGTDFIFEKKQFIFSVNATTISAKIYSEYGEIFVEETEDAKIPANKWIINRLANLPILSARILDKIKDEAQFIEPSAHLLPNLSSESTDDNFHVPRALASLLESIDNRSPLETSMIYITSDAGEGKTWLINAAARKQAQRFNKGESDWLLVPIVLGGRNFLRFDDITVGALQNKYRFPFLYYNSFLALVRMGVIVPAFDGFEEMFVESSSGEALSAMGILVNALKSTGAVTIAARKAYFEFENLKSQETLYDSIRNYDVSFAKLQISRWGKNEFIKYCQLRDVQNPESLYSDIAKRITPTHSLLTRPVLVHRLINIVQESSSVDSFLETVSVSGAKFFSVFVREIIRREAFDKWIDRSGAGDSASLISIDEHCELLSMIAIQMWESRTSYLKLELLDVVTDIFCETHKKTPHQTHQIRERIRGHALLIASSDINSAVEFDHDEFRLFFLGEGLANLILANIPSSKSEVFSILRRGSLPQHAALSCLHKIQRNEQSGPLSVSLLNSISQLDGQASYTRENCGNLIMKIITSMQMDGTDLNELIFGIDALRDCKLKNTTFRKCYFSSTSLELMTAENCHFFECNFGVIKFSESSKFINCSMIGCEIEAIKPNTGSHELWDPADISGFLIKSGIHLNEGKQNLSNQNSTDFLIDEDFDCLQKIIRYFLRSTQISEPIIKMRLSDKGQDFIDRILPDLMENNIIIEFDNKGRGSRRMFKLGKSLHDINKLLKKSAGSYKNFISLIKI